MRDISIQTVVEAMGKNEVFQECLYDESRGETKTLILKDETPKWKTTRRIRRKIRKMRVKLMVSRIPKATWKSISSIKG